MRAIRSSGSVEGVMGNHDPYSDLVFPETFSQAAYQMLGGVRDSRYFIE